MSATGTPRRRFSPDARVAGLGRGSGWYGAEREGCLTRTYSGSREDTEDTEEAGEWDARGAGSRRRGVAPRTAPSLRVERRRRARSAGASALRVGGAGRAMWKADMVVGGS